MRILNGNGALITAEKENIKKKVVKFSRLCERKRIKTKGN